MRFALLELKVALANMILELDMELVPGREEISFDVSPIVMRPKDGLPLIVKPISQTIHTA